MANTRIYNNPFSQWTQHSICKVYCFLALGHLFYSETNGLSTWNHAWNCTHNTKAFVSIHILNIMEYTANVSLSVGVLHCISNTIRAEHQNQFGFSLALFSTMFSNANATMVKTRDGDREGVRGASGRDRDKKLETEVHKLQNCQWVKVYCRSELIRLCIRIYSFCRFSFLLFGHLKWLSFASFNIPPFLVHFATIQINSFRDRFWLFWRPIH